MKSVIAWPVSWGLYATGHAFYWLCENTPDWEWLYWLAIVYQRLMGYSLFVHRWGNDCGPWRPTTDMDDL